MSKRLIIDNVLVAFKTMHHINQKKSGKVGEMVVKLDMSKAYDRVEWGRHITPTQGLRQGNPLSPYLFFICVEGLFALLMKFVEDGWLKGVEACPRRLAISHLFFAYDSLIFCQATREDCTSLENILETYEHAFGQQVNSDKTSLFFSSNTPQDI